MRDATTPIDEAVRALDDQVRLGSVLYVGISDSPAWVVAQANTIADLRGWSPFVALQVPYSAAGRQPERASRWRRRSASRSWPGASSRRGSSPGSRTQSAAGPRTGSPSGSPASSTPSSASRASAAPRAGRDRVGRQRPAPPTVIPLVAATREAQIVENLVAVEIELDPDELAVIDDAGEPELGFRATSSSRLASAS